MLCVPDWPLCELESLVKQEKKKKKRACGKKIEILLKYFFKVQISMKLLSFLSFLFFHFSFQLIC